MDTIAASGTERLQKTVVNLHTAENGEHQQQQRYQPMTFVKRMKMEMRIDNIKAEESDNKQNLYYILYKIYICIYTHNINCKILYGIYLYI